MRVSLLDRSRIREGESDGDAVATTIARAERAERWGFHRFLTAEHHGVPGIASSTPAVLAAAIGARTRSIRIGTGGIMVPNHRPIVIAEQALLLEALYPGRVDVGLGGSLGFTTRVRKALGRRTLGEGEYAAELDQVQQYLRGEGEVLVRPAVTAPPVFLLAIKNGLRLAAERGLPVAVGGPLLDQPDAIREYFTAFRPTPEVPEPYLMAAVEVVVADTTAGARELLLPEAWAHAQSREIGEFRALQPVSKVRRALDEGADPKKKAVVERFLDGTIAGTPANVAADLHELVERVGASEILASVSTYDSRDVERTDRFLAGL